MPFKAIFIFFNSKSQDYNTQHALMNIIKSLCNAKYHLFIRKIQ